MKIDSLIFDLDGTLWNSTKTVADAWNEVFEQLGIQKQLSADEVLRVMGLQWPQIVETYFSEYDEEILDQIKTRIDKNELVHIKAHGATPMPGMLSTIHSLKEKYRLFIVSNCQEGYVDAFLDLFDLWDDFEGFICAEVTGLSKGENNKMLIEKYNLETPVYIGDTSGDLESARVAQIPFIYASYGFGKIDEEEEVREIRCLNELEELLESMVSEEG